MNNPISISLCMIVKNEEETLGRCLSSVKDIVDEIIIVDTGSTDNTKKIVKDFNGKIFDFEWIEDFAAARNYAFSKASNDYILWLDADDFLDEENIGKFKNLRTNLESQYDTVTMDYSLSRDESGKTTFSLKRNRLVKKSKNFKWIGKVHEYLEVFGLSYNSDVVVNHGKLRETTDRNLKIFKKMLKNNVKFSTRDKFYYSNELYYNLLYKEAIKSYEEFLLLNDSWIEDKKVAFNNLSQCYINTNNTNKLLDTIFRLFKIATPSGEICCKLADHFNENSKYDQAIFWYKVALECIPSKNNMSYNNREFYTWIPAINLSVCYSKIDDYDTAYYYNELAGSYEYANKVKIESNRAFYKKKFLEKGLTLPKITL